MGDGGGERHEPVGAVYRSLDECWGGGGDTAGGCGGLYGGEVKTVREDVLGGGADSPELDVVEGVWEESGLPCLGELDAVALGVVGVGGGGDFLKTYFYCFTRTQSLVSDEGSRSKSTN